MSAIILISVLLRVVATIWSLGVTWRLRDGRVLLLTAMFALMTFRQTLTLFSGFSSGVELSLNLDATTHLDELPGLIVSLIAFLIVLNVEGFSASGFREPPIRTDESARGVPLLPVLAIGLASILGIVLLSYFAYDGSRAALRTCACPG